jgi:hypothetical protein
MRQFVVVNVFVECSRCCFQRLFINGGCRLSVEAGFVGRAGDAVGRGILVNNKHQRSSRSETEQLGHQNRQPRMPANVLFPSAKEVRLIYLFI